MGSRGPVGKRLADVQGHKSKAELSPVSLTVVGAQPVVQPEAPDYWCPVAFRLWESMGQSGQSRFYEPSDWAFAWLMMDLVGRFSDFRSRTKEKYDNYIPPNRDNP